MKILVTKASDWEFNEMIEINTLEDLFKFQEDCGRPLVLANSYKKDCEKHITIYDDYLE